MVMMELMIELFGSNKQLKAYFMAEYSERTSQMNGYNDFLNPISHHFITD